jgi:hypothetical protein
MSEGEKKQVTHTVVPREMSRKKKKKPPPKKSLLEWLPFGKEFGAFLLLLHIVVVGTCFAFFHIFLLFYYVVQTTFTSDIRKEKIKKGRESQQPSSTLLRFREMPSVCVGSGKKIK